MMQDRICIYSLPRRDMTPTEALDYAHSMKMGACELLFLGETPIPDDAQVIAWRRHADSLGIVIPNISIGIELCDPNGDAAVDTLQAYAHIAKLLGAPSIMTTVYSSLSPDCRDADAEPLMQLASARLRRVWDYCESIGILVSLEEQGRIFNGYKMFSELLHRIDRPMRIVLDAGNPAFVGEDSLPVLQAFADRITHVHLKDFAFVQGADAVPNLCLRDGRVLRRRLLGDGDMQIPKILAQLRDLDYRGWFSLECVEIQDFAAEQARNIAWLKSMLQAR